MKMKRILSIICACALSGAAAMAQSENFKLAQSLDIQNSVLRQLATSYVDTLDFDKLIKTGIDAMLESLDPYTVYFPEELEDDVEMMTTGIYGGVGALIKKRPGEGVLITQPYANTPGVKAGLQPGDTIFSINGNYVYDLSSEECSNRMKGQPGTDVEFKVIKGGATDTTLITVHRDLVHVSSIDYYGLYRDTLGYVSVNGFTQKMTEELRAAIEDLKSQGAKRLILDLRSNGGGLMDEAVNMVSLFVPKGTLAVSSKGRQGEMNKEYRTTKEPVDTEIPILVMVNSGTASSSEIFAGALQDLDRAVIGGKRSFGKGLIQTILPTSYNGAVKVTTGKYYTPSGRCVQAIDYSHRNSDGSVGAVPDSLIKEFKTANGRTVKDGGGITPDIIAEAHTFSRPAYSLVMNDITGDYALKYFIEHKSIAPASEFYMTDEEYEDFIEYAQTREFDFRSGIKAELDNLIKAAKYDGVYDSCKEEIDALSKSVDIDKATTLRNNKAEIKHLLEAEIVQKYYYQAAGVVVELRNDEQLDNVLKEWK